jgi:hypothetical protein
MVDVLMGFHRPTFSKPNTELNSIYMLPFVVVGGTAMFGLNIEAFRM